MRKTKQFYVQVYLMLDELDHRLHKNYFNPEHPHYQSEYLKGAMDTLDTIQVKIESELEKFLEDNLYG